MMRCRSSATELQDALRPCLPQMYAPQVPCGQMRRVRACRAAGGACREGSACTAGRAASQAGAHSLGHLDAGAAHAGVVLAALVPGGPAAGDVVDHALAVLDAHSRGRRRGAAREAPVNGLSSLQRLALAASRLTPVFGTLPEGRE